MLLSAEPALAKAWQRERYAMPALNPQHWPLLLAPDELNRPSSLRQVAPRPSSEEMRDQWR